ncbi:MAG: phosphoribosylglycinamide formyltransferase [Clostridium sp.]
MLKIAVLVSGGGSNLQSIIDNIDSKKLNCSIEYVISDRAGAYGIERAKKVGIKTVELNRKELKSELSNTILEIVKGKVDVIVLAGYLSIINGEILKEFKNKIINIHPSLIPSFCGCGMYGIKVHEAVIEYGCKIAGCTVHLVDEGTDTGAIIIQKVVEIREDDTSEVLQKRVLEQEHKALPEAISYFAENMIEIEDRKVKIRKQN